MAWEKLQWQDLVNLLTKLWVALKTNFLNILENKFLKKDHTPWSKTITWLVCPKYNFCVISSVDNAVNDNYSLLAYAILIGDSLPTPQSN